MQFRNLNPMAESVCCSGVLSLYSTVWVFMDHKSTVKSSKISLPKNVIDVQVAEFKQPLEAQFQQATAVAEDFLPCPGSRH